MESANTRHDSNQELIGQGLANIFSPLFGGFAARGPVEEETKLAGL
jgi:SulP family sulfate permease